MTDTLSLVVVRLLICRFYCRTERPAPALNPVWPCALLCRSMHTRARAHMWPFLSVDFHGCIPLSPGSSSRKNRIQRESCELPCSWIFVSSVLSVQCGRSCECECGWMWVQSAADLGPAKFRWSAHTSHTQTHITAPIRWWSVVFVWCSQTKALIVTYYYVVGVLAKRFFFVLSRHHVFGPRIWAI